MKQIEITEKMREVVEKRAEAFAEKVLPLYKLLNWHWAGEEINVKTIKETVFTLYRHAVESRSSASGGIYVEVFKDPTVFEISFLYSEFSAMAISKEIIEAYEL